MYALISDCDGEFLRSSLSDIADFQDAFFFFLQKRKKSTLCNCVEIFVH